MARSAGSAVQLVAKDGDHGVLRLPSGEMRRVLLTCRATVGQVGNTDHANQPSGKAGRSRWLGKRPTVRGSAMNPVDHPHGGGEGKSKGGRHPVTPWGVPTLGKRTRRKHKESDKLIVRGRRRGKERKRSESQSSKKGPFVEERLMSRIEAMNATGREADDPHLVARLDDLPGDGRAHDRRPRRPQARARVRDRADGRAQARRVRADADLPRPRGRPADAGEEAADGRTTDDDTQRVRAQAKWVRTSARKARLVLDHIRGRSVPEARTILAFTQRAAATDIEKVLRSAVANAEANHGLDGDELVVEAAYADEGPTLKRWKPRARGRVNRIRKRTCHITLVLAEQLAEAARRGRTAPAQPTAEKPSDGGPAEAARAATRRSRRSDPTARKRRSTTQEEGRR